MTSTVKTASWLPSAIESSTPVIVNACGVAQFDDVNVNGAPTCASPESPENARITTSPPGCESNTTVNWAVVPDSATDTDVVDRVNPTVSSSAVVTFQLMSSTSS